MSPPADNRPLAIGSRLIKKEGIRTLGFKPNFTDYSQTEQALIRKAPKIYFPTAFYADLFNAMGKLTFPSFHTFKFTLDKIKQTAMFNLMGIPHPKTFVFYGRRQKQNILDCFKFPFIAKKARGSARGEDVYLITNTRELSAYLEQSGPAYIQEYLPVKKDIRIIIIGDKIRLAFWREAGPDNFKTNISQGGKISFDTVPGAAKDMALYTARSCGWDDVGIDIVEFENRYFVLEGNMKYGTKGFRAAGIDYKKLLCDLILNKEI